jgi:conjugal transfer pilus assembly protein TraV
VLLGVFFLGGCSVVNPYRSDFKCPPLDDGKCISVGEAYDEALGFGKDLGPRRECPKEPAPTPPCEPCPNWPDCGDDWCEEAAGDPQEPCTEAPAPPPPTPAEEYQGALYRRLAGLVQEPRTPLVAPPEVLRVWLLPYEGEGGELFMERYVYVMVEKPRWVLGTYLTEPDGTTESERSAQPEGK